MSEAVESIAEVNPAHPPRVGVVEDDPLSRSLLTHLVALLGYTAVEPPNPAAAIQAALNGEVDVLLLDLDLAEDDGFQIVNRLRALEAAHSGRRIPVIAVTGYVTAADRARCLAAGFDRHIGKPVNVADLREAIATTLTAQPQPAVRISSGNDAERVAELARRLREQQSGERVLGPTALEQFAMRSSHQVDQLRAALDAGELAALDHAAQVIGTDAETMGAKRLRKLAAALSAAARLGDHDEVAQCVARIEAEHAAILRLLLSRPAE